MNDGSFRTPEFRRLFSALRSSMGKAEYWLGMDFLPKLIRWLITGSAHHTTLRELQNVCAAGTVIVRQCRGKLHLSSYVVIGSLRLGRLKGWVRETISPFARWACSSSVRLSLDYEYSMYHTRYRQDSGNDLKIDKILQTKSNISTVMRRNKESSVARAPTLPWVRDSPPADRTPEPSDGSSTWARISLPR